MNVKPVKTVVLGCGMISDIYLTTLSTKFKIIDLVACCDLDSEKAESMANKYRIKSMTMDEIKNDSSIELVVNLTAATAHYKIIKELLNAGKHVYSEKVLSPTLEEGKELVDLANEKKLYLGVAPDTFLGSAIQTANYVVESGMIGEVTSCYAALNRDSSLFAELSPAGTLPGGGIGFDMGIYYVTALLSILGPVKTVTGIVDTKNPERTHQVVSKMGESFKMNCENIMSGTMVFENGITGNLLFDSNSIMILPEKPALVINGTLGVMYMNDPNLFGGDVNVILKGNNTPSIIPQCHPFQENYRGVGVAEMAWSMRKGRNNRASKEMSYHALEVLSGICISSQNRAHYDLQSTFVKPSPLPRGYVGTHFFKEIEETTITD